MYELAAAQCRPPFFFNLKTMEQIEVYCNRIKAEGTNLSTSELKAQWHELNNAETETETETTKTKKPKK